MYTRVGVKTMTLRVAQQIVDREREGSSRIPWLGETRSRSSLERRDAVSVWKNSGNLLRVAWSRRKWRSLGRSLTRRNFQTLANGDFQAKWLSWLKGGLLVVWSVFPEREREREKKISLAPGIKFRLADREMSLTSPSPFPLSILIRPLSRVLHGNQMAKREL